MSRSKEPRTTIHHVAQRAGVSIGSVSRVLNGKPSVTDDIRQRVEAAVRELAFRPDSAAQTMRSRTTRTVGCIIRDINIPAFAKFVRAADEVLLEAHYALLLSNSGGNPERERNLISVMVARKADALIIGQYSESDPSLATVLERSGIPVVLIDRVEPRWADSVLIDHRGGVRQATEKLLGLGHRRIALLTGRDVLFPASERIAGYRAAFEARGLECDPHLIRTGSFQREFGFEQTSLLLAEPERPTAILSGGIDMFPGVIRAVRTHGLAVPRDISIVAALDTDLTEMLDPSISVETWNYAEVGRLAAGFALDRIHTGAASPPKRLTCPTTFIMRDSVGPPP